MDTILRYETPIGVYTVTENLEIYKDGKKIGQEDSIYNCKKIISGQIKYDRDSLIVEIQTRLRAVIDMNSNFETYKKRPVW